MEFIIGTNIIPATIASTKYPHLSHFGVFFNTIDTKVSYEKKSRTFISIFR